ncbi:hypothetical protein BpHYR1_042799 [Brachionus plicatilis]|uniref:Uncharacterized protein n=1 Tax=Brachionus plicatilis TaxID=10195 RepID=A0A3M7SQN4_BRAPC|nr:hypothetical protein BpHYR1_042799 [Brachionus plicatilis]
MSDNLPICSEIIIQNKPKNINNIENIYHKANYQKIYWDNLIIQNEYKLSLENRLNILNLITEVLNDIHSEMIEVTRKLSKKVLVKNGKTKLIIETYSLTLITSCSRKNSDENKERSSEHLKKSFEKLFNEKITREDDLQYLKNIEVKISDFELKITEMSDHYNINDVRYLIFNLTNRKSTGFSDVSNEMYKYGCSDVLRKLSSME